jgi:hypothetical protein
MGCHVGKAMQRFVCTPDGHAIVWLLIMVLRLPDWFFWNIYRNTAALVSCNLAPQGERYAPADLCCVARAVTAGGTTPCFRHVRCARRGVFFLRVACVRSFLDHGYDMEGDNPGFPELRLPDMEVRRLETQVDMTDL